MDESDYKLNDDIISTPKDPYAREKKKHPFGKGFLFGFIAAIGTLVLGFGVAVAILAFGGINSSGGDIVKSIYDDDYLLSDEVDTKLDHLVTLIETFGYYDLDEIDIESGVYKGLIKALDDDYAYYFTPDEYEYELTSETGSFGGIGATLQKDKDKGTVTVVNVYKNSPAERANLKTGDVLVSADGHEAVDLTLDEFVGFVRGEKGTTVHLEVYREGLSEYMEVDIVRDIIDIISVEGQMLEDDIALITIDSFSDNTKSQLDEIYDEFEAQGMRAIIYDLRTNGGGLLDSVTEILDEILPDGITVYTETRSGEREDFKSDADCMSYPIVVLTSGYTASAAEIFTGAIQDYDYGTVLGTTTFGKGIVQTIMPLGDGSALKITTSKYFTPSGRCIHGEGIAPDEELEFEFLGTDEENYNVYLDNQIIRAMQILGSDIEMPVSAE